MFHRFLPLTLALFFSLFSLPPVAAAQTSALTISPPVIEVLLAPNKKVVHAFEISNQGESSDFIANLHNFTPTDNIGHGTVSPTPLDPTSVPLILRLANSDRQLRVPFSLPSGASTQLVLEVESATFDLSVDSYLALVVSPKTNDVTPQNSTSQTIPGLASLILVTLTPDGNLPIKLNIEDFDLPLLHDNLTPLYLRPTLYNASPIMLRAGGSLEIISPRERTHFTLPLYPNLILKESKRIIQGSNQADPPLPTPLTWQPSLFNLGPYRIRLHITTVGGSQITEIEKTIWLLPIRAIIIVILIAVISIYLLLSLKKRPSSKTSPTSQ